MTTQSTLSAFSRILILLAMAGTASLRADWRDELTAPEPGEFPPLRSVQLEYLCGWAGLKAGEVEARFTQPSPDICELDVKAATTGLARTLWRLDATHVARGSSSTLRPLSVRQAEVYRYQTLRTLLDFDERGVTHLRESTNDKFLARRKRYDFPDLFDLQTTLLFVRSQKLQTGQVYRMAVYAGTNPYLAMVTVLGRERIKVRAGTYPAIKMDLRLEKITPDMKLEPHGKFKRATGWLSDDADRLPLRLNAQIFIGSVWAELVKVE